jgi:Tol biopolymer transport system component
VISPDGSQIAFAAVGDIYVMPVTGGAPTNLTKDVALDTDPSWSPDGNSLVYSSDKDSPFLQLWIRDMKSGQSRKVTNLNTQPQGASFSPDGKKIVFFNVDGMWRVAEMSILDVASGRSPGFTNRCRSPAPRPGRPTASASRWPASRR